MNSLVQSLSKASMFSGCSFNLLEQIIASPRHRVRRKDKGAHIAYMGDEVESVIVLVEGTSYSSMTNQEGREVVIESLTAPVVLAPAFVFAENNHFPVNVIANTECTLFYIDKSFFRELLHREPKLMMNFIGIISNRCQRLSQRLNGFVLLSLKERVIEYLRQHQRIESVEWLAKVLGVARPSLSRVLSELKSEGEIERTLEGIVLKKQDS